MTQNMGVRTVTAQQGGSLSCGSSSSRISSSQSWLRGIQGSPSPGSCLKGVNGQCWLRPSPPLKAGSSSRTCRLKASSVVPREGPQAEHLVLNLRKNAVWKESRSFSSTDVIEMGISALVWELRGRHGPQLYLWPVQTVLVCSVRVMRMAPLKLW